MDEQKMTGFASIDKPWLKYYTTEAITAPLPECSMYEYLAQKIKGRESLTALNYFGTKISYGRLMHEIDRAASAFAERGVKAGDIVTICAITTPEVVYSIYGLNKLGATCNIIEPRVNIEQIMQRTQQAQSRIIVLCDVFYSKLHSMIDQLGLSAIIIPVSGSMPLAKRLAISAAGKMPHWEGSAWKEFIAHGSASGISPFYERDHTAAIIYTGGTTGISKGVMLSDDAVNSVAHQYILCAGIKAGHKFLDIMPPFIAYGFACGLHMPLSGGVEVVVIPKFEPEKFAELIKKHRPNYFLGVPSHYEGLIHSGELDGVDLSFIEVAGMGGDALNAQAEREINAFFASHGLALTVDKGYGMTEMCSSVCTTGANINDLGSVGVPLPRSTIAIFEQGSDRELKYGESGEICIKGPGMMLGYFSNPAETEKVIKRHSDGSDWVHSQDIGYMTENGSLFIVGRMKRMLIRPDGHNVWPSQIESVICSHPAVAQCSVVGQRVDGRKSGVLPAAFVVVNGEYEHERLRQELIKLNFEKFPERDIAQYYYFVDALPLTPVGKVDYRRLEEMANGK